MTHGRDHEVAEEAGRRLEAVRASRPKIHCLTNFVAQTLSANVLLAVGAVPSMTMDAQVAGDFVRSSDGLLVNLGQLDPWRREAIPLAVDAARGSGKPWVLDPVKVQRAGARAETARQLIGEDPAVVRCNADEREILQVPQSIVLAVTGEVDSVSLAGRQQRIANGSALMDRVTAMGCALSALITSFVAADDGDPFAAAVAAILVFDIAGEMAEARARGPGSFQIELLDALYALKPADITERARLS